MDDASTQRLLPHDDSNPKARDHHSSEDHHSSDQESQQMREDVREFESTIVKALTKSLEGSAQLANMLPTGTVLFFQMLDPILFRAGDCQDKQLSAVFLILCALTCFILSFTDSFQAPNGKVYYGFATFRGLWTPEIDPSSLTNINLSKYRITAADFVHAFLAVFTFMTTTSFSTDVVSCFFKVPQDFIKVAPSLTGFLASSVFLVFPTTRHGVGFPVKR